MRRWTTGLGAKVAALFSVAHCDIPCGIYDPGPAQIAARTVQTMVTKIRDLRPPKPDAPAPEWEAYHNAVTRLVQVKEEHAQLCKKELLVLWTDYFKEPHVKMFPDLHATFWNAAKLCSRNKQNVDPSAAEELVRTTRRVAEMFAKAEAARGA